MIDLVLPMLASKQELMSKSEEKNRRFAYIQKESTTREAEMRQSVADAEVMISSLTTEKQELRSALDAVTKSEEELKRRCEEIERNAKAAETKQNGETLALKGEHAKEIDSLKSSARKELEEQASCSRLQTERRRERERGYFHLKN